MTSKKVPRLLAGFFNRGLTRRLVISVSFRILRRLPGATSESFSVFTFVIFPETFFNGTQFSHDIKPWLQTHYENFLQFNRRPFRRTLENGLNGSP